MKQLKKNKKVYLKKKRAMLREERVQKQATKQKIKTL